MMHRFVSLSLAVLFVVSSAFASSLVAPAAASADSCRFVLGFQTIHDALPDTVGNCLDNEVYDDTGAVQHTARGLMAWRSADNFTAFTDGYRSWVNGPYGIKQRLNTERFAWEAYDPMVLALQLPDMPAGFSQLPGVSRYTSNQWLANQTNDPQKLLALYQQWGRTNGYRTAFLRINLADPNGTSFVIDDINAFQTADGAHSAYLLEQMGAVGETQITRLSVPAIGDEVMAYQTTREQTAGGRKMSATAFVLVFRRANVLATVSTAGLTNATSVDDLVNYARIVDKRAKEYPLRAER